MDPTPLSVRGDCAKGDADFDVALAADGIIDVTIRGVWTIEQVNRFFDAIAPVHRTSRALHGHVRSLIRVENVQSPLVALHVRERAVPLKMAQDRNAVIVASFLSKLQITRLASTRNFALFTDAQGAREWLLRP